ncbi:MAG: hypothetical protein ACLUR5_14700 [Eubacterium ventriosum]
MHSSVSGTVKKIEQRVSS